jgi:hypothetical protein
MILPVVVLALHRSSPRVEGMRGDQFCGSDFPYRRVPCP